MARMKTNKWKPKNKKNTSISSHAHPLAIILSTHTLATVWVGTCNLTFSFPSLALLWPPGSLSATVLPFATSWPLTLVVPLSLLWPHLLAHPTFACSYTITPKHMSNQVYMLPCPHIAHPHAHKHIHVSPCHTLHPSMWLTHTSMYVWLHKPTCSPTHMLAQMHMHQGI